ncbi:MAG TPA: hypothetical protein VLT91_11225 [Rhizomicrobium sp.]|nr:hypothetical protein [Rhizomicrobium sp.]
MTFLVGAGVMLGAFLTGFAQQVPAFFSHYSQYDVPADPGSHDQVLTVQDDIQDAAPADMAGSLRPEFVVRVESPSGDFNSSGCNLSYRFSNRTGVPVAFETDADEGSVAVPPGGEAGPQDDSGNCGPVIRIKIER